MQTKVCSKCKQDKPYSEYFKDKKRKIGIRCKCKECCKIDTYQWREKNRSEYNSYSAMWRSKNPDKQHASDIKRCYGLEIKNYDEILKDQNYRCKICDKKHDATTKRGRLYVDHDHATGKIRGLLCQLCNSMIGYSDDSIGRLQKAIEYLKS